MFEFHGWVVIHASESEHREEHAKLSEQALEFVRSAIEEEQDNFCHLSLVQAGNGMDVLTLHGLRNHRRENAVVLFGRIAAQLPESYGLLYFNDAESEHFYNDFRIYRMAHGKVEEFSDTLLSPRVPTIESPHYPEHLQELSDHRKQLGDSSQSGE